MVLRRNIVNTMLFIIEYYEFNNATSFEATEVLQIMQIALDDEDIESIK